MNKPRRPSIKSVTVPFHKLPPAVKTRVLMAESRSAELVEILNELVPSTPTKDLRVEALEKEVRDARKALDAALTLLAYYQREV
jgi:hypothetical protein